MGLASGSRIRNTSCVVRTSLEKSMSRSLIYRHWRPTAGAGFAVLAIVATAWWAWPDSTENSSGLVELSEHDGALGANASTTPLVASPGARSGFVKERPTNWINLLVKDAPIAFSDYDGTNGIITVDRKTLANVAVGDTVQLVFGEHKLHYIVGARRADDEHGIYIGLGAVDVEQSVDKGFYSAYYLYPDGSGRVLVNSEVVDIDAEFGADGDQAPFVNRLALREQYLKQHGALPPID